MIRKLFVLFVCFMFTACQMSFGQAMSEDIIPADTGVGSAAGLMPGYVTVNFKGADIRAVLNYLADVGGVDIVPAPDVTGQITMKLTEKPWEVALDILVRNYGYVLVKEREVIRVVRKESLEGEEQVTEVIDLNYIVPPRDLSGIRRTGDQDTDSGQSGVNMGGSSSSDKDKPLLPELIKAIEAILKSGESVTFLGSANAIIVTAIPARVNKVREMIKKVDKAPQQIMMEAKIIELQLSDNERMGIDWNAKIAVSGAKRPITFPFENTGNIGALGEEVAKYLPYGKADGTVGFPTDTATAQSTKFPYLVASYDSDNPLASAFTYGTLDFSQFSAVLEYIDERDNTKILATPRITTLNNEEAYIRATTNIFLEKVTTSTETTSTVGSEFETEPRESGVILQVIPHINDKGEISVTLKPTIDGSVTFSALVSSGAGANKVAMQYTSRTAETRIRIKDGDTIFIGGLINESKQTQDHKLPLLGDLLGGVPVVGGLFKYDRDVTERTEVVIFVTVNVVKDINNFNIRATNNVSPKIIPESIIKNRLEKSNFAKRTSHPAEETKKRKPFLDFRKKKS